jgi:signal transduction histidine kinase
MASAMKSELRRQRLPGSAAPDASVALLRVAQESLVNAAKHAEGQGVEVRLDYSDADVRLTVRNDLPPAPARRARPA